MYCFLYGRQPLTLPKTVCFSDFLQLVFRFPFAKQYTNFKNGLLSLSNEHVTCTFSSMNFL